MKKDNQIKHKNLEEALMTFRHTLTSALVNEARGKGVSLSHFEVIKFIAEEDSVTMKDIALKLHITPPSASAIIDALVAKNLVIRKRLKEDRRTVMIKLAPKAHIFITSIYKHKSSVFNKMLTKLSNKDKNELARILKKCI